MFFIIAGILLLAIQAFLILSTKFTFWPEIVTFSWLVSKGLIPYRDFFDHHGFLLYYLLSPLLKNTSFLSLKLFFLLVQSINLFFILLIIGKKSDKTVFVLGGILFIFLNYFVNVNTLWYEMVITSFLLGAYYLSNIKNKDSFTQIFIGLFIALASFIKPTAGIFIIPTILFYRNIIPLLLFLISWLFVIYSYHLIGNAQQLFNDLFFFNSYLSRNYHNPYYSDFKFHLSLFLVSVLILFFSWKVKKLQIIIKPFLWMTFSLIFVFYLYNRSHLVPLISFFSIMVVVGINVVDKKLRYVFTCMLIVYLIFLRGKIAVERNRINRTIPWQENKIRSEILHYAKNNNFGNKKIYVFGNQGDLYVSLNQLPPTKYPLMFPLVNRYIPKFETQFINELSRNKVGMIIVPLPIEEQFSKLVILNSFIKNTYFLTLKTKDFEIYTR